MDYKNKLCSGENLEYLISKLRVWITEITQIQADWAKTDELAMDYIENKPSIDPGDGERSLIAGNNTSATGQYSIAVGQNCAASGIASVAGGAGSAALGDFSHALGVSAQAVSKGSTAIGYLTSAGCRGYYMTAIDTAHSMIYIDTVQNNNPHLGTDFNSDGTTPDTAYWNTSFDAPQWTLESTDAAGEIGDTTLSEANLKKLLALL